MSGMSLRTGFSAGGSYTPLYPASASAPSSTISQKAYGINGSGESQNSTAAYGSISVGVVAVAALIYLWWSLPR